MPLSLGTEGISSMKGEHGSNKWRGRFLGVVVVGGGGAISMLEIASTQGLLDHDTSQAVLIIWTAPSAPLIFYPRQFMWSSVCTHTVHFTGKKKRWGGLGGRKALSSVPLWQGASAWLAVMIQRLSERSSRGSSAEDGWAEGWGGGVGWALPRQGGCLCTLSYRVPPLCLIESMSTLKAV